MTYYKYYTNMEYVYAFSMLDGKIVDMIYGNKTLNELKNREVFVKEMKKEILSHFKSHKNRYVKITPEEFEHLMMEVL